MRILHLSSWSVTPVTHGRSDCFGKIHKNHRITVFTDSSFLTSLIFFFLHLPRIFDQLCWLPVFLFCNNQSEDDPNLSWFQNELKNSRWGLFFDHLLFGLIEPEEGGIDFAVFDLTITSSRAEAVKFSMPFLNLGISIMFIKPRKAPPSLVSFLAPFTNEVWVWIILGN